MFLSVVLQKNLCSNEEKEAMAAITHHIDKRIVEEDRRTETERARKNHKKTTGSYAQVALFGAFIRERVLGGWLGDGRQSNDRGQGGA